ncbi:unnamed protein product [Nezara viridula]|uniref:Uncharacterized protein n=1 Tax=Nezara viridula TaxID=85310 RepID=A0A9P0HQB9_NEZVI|nr:unnamed protein product [Nezara viridula]
MRGSRLRNPDSVDIGSITRTVFAEDSADGTNRYCLLPVSLGHPQSVITVRRQPSRALLVSGFGLTIVTSRQTQDNPAFAPDQQWGRSTLTTGPRQTGGEERIESRPGGDKGLH